MRYICNHCDEVFDEDDRQPLSELVGEFWGSPAYDTYWVCPNCGSEDYEEYTDEDDEILEEEEENIIEDEEEDT